jgi:hypothetical protein
MGSQAPSFDHYQFERRPLTEILEDRSADDYSYDDRKFFHVQRYHISERVRNPYFANQELVRELIVRMVEKRSLIYPIPGPGNYAVRLMRAEQKLEQSIIPKYIATMDKLCHEYVELRKFPNRCKREQQLLAVQIRNADSAIRAARMGPLLYAAVAWYYFRMGLHSKEVGEILGIRHQALRQLAYRMIQTAKEIEAEQARHNTALT